MIGKEQQLLRTNANAASVVTMIGTSTRAQGGVAAVVRALVSGGLSELYVVDYLETHCDGSGARKLFLAIGAFFRLFLKLISGKVSLLHVHVASRASFWRKSALILISYAFRKPVLLHLHGGEFHIFYEEESSLLATRVIRYVFEHAAGVIVLSEGRKSWVQAAFPGAKVSLIYNPAPTVAIDESISRMEGTLLFLGRLSDQKGTGDLVRAVARIAATHGEIRLLLGGEGDVAGTRDLAERLGVGSHVDTLGWVTGDTKMALLDHAAVFVLPSYNEGLPMGVLEAMAHGMPVVATPVGGIPEAIANGVEGFLVAPGDIDSLAHALERLLKDAELRRSMGKAAQRKVASTFAIERIIRQWVELYAEHGVVPLTSVSQRIS